DEAAVRHGQDVLGGIPLVHVVPSLFDAPLPGAGLQINVGFTEVALVGSGGTVVPLTTFAAPDVVNLLNLQNAALPLAGNVPPGSYTAIRFFISPAASDIVLGPIKIPLGTKTSPIVTADAPVALTAVAGEPLDVAADFNALESFSVTGNHASMSPTIVAAVDAGSLKGTVVNAKGAPVTEATVEALDANGNLVNVTATGANGGFAMHALPAGTYTLQIVNSFTSKFGDVVKANGNDPGA